MRRVLISLVLLLAAGVASAQDFSIGACFQRNADSPAAAAVVCTNTSLRRIDAQWYNWVEERTIRLDRRERFLGLLSLWLQRREDNRTVEAMERFYRDTIPLLAREIEKLEKEESA